VLVTESLGVALVECVAELISVAVPFGACLVALVGQSVDDALRGVLCSGVECVRGADASYAERR